MNITNKEEKVLKDFYNVDTSIVAKAVKDNASGELDNSFEGKRSQKELDKFLDGAILILDKIKSK